MMKRLGVLLFVASALTACRAPSADGDTAAAAALSAWSRPPSIAAVARERGVVIVSGQADPGARVVLRDDSGGAFAASADAQGKFVVRIAEPRGDSILTPEVQNGQEAAASPDRLVVLVEGPMAVLRAGGSSVRLDAVSGPLDAVDSDGRTLLASGRAAPGEEVVVNVAGEALSATARADGRWSLMLPPNASSITLAGAVYALPTWTGEGVSAAGGGWLVGWRTPDGALQRVWLPVKT